MQKTPKPQSLDEIRRTPIDRIAPVASAPILRRVLRSGVTRFTAAI
ncbi:hypothetical protein AB0J83_20010 [Actinoplanes sp. NPDC049596]